MRLLDLMLTFAHLAVIGFNVFGWIWPQTRKAHMVIVGLTLASWLICGLWYGLGYCFLTDWHWSIKGKLGEENLPDSFIKYFADKITGSDHNPQSVNTVTAISFILIIIVTVYINFIHPKKV